jgi:hypothetical protein
MSMPRVSKKSESKPSSKAQRHHAHRLVPGQLERHSRVPRENGLVWSGLCKPCTEIEKCNRVSDLQSAGIRLADDV